MDKWKDIELEKMKVGGNRPAKDFFLQHADFDPSTTNLHEKYNSRAAALYRDKIGTEARGNSWSIDASPAFTFQPANADESSASNPKLWGFGSSTTPSTRPATSISNLSTNASKWAGVAKDSVVKFSKNAATKATELSTKVSEQAKDGTLMTNVQSGVTNVASTVGQFGTKTWSGMQSFFQAKKASPSADQPRLEIQRSPSATVRRFRANATRLFPFSFSER